MRSFVILTLYNSIMILIVGLGNPGEKYGRTRHNIGFMVVEQFLKDFEPVGKTVWEDNKKFKSDIVELLWTRKKGGEEKVLLAKPKTYMNNSGLAVSLISQYLHITVSDIWIVHDDIDLPLGKIKIRIGGGSAGHRGVESIIRALGTDQFIRFRLGIGKPFKGKDPRNKGRRAMEKVDDYVLSRFVPGETHELKELVKKATKALEVALEKGLEATMNRFNAK